MLTGRGENHQEATGMLRTKTRRFVHFAYCEPFILPRLAAGACGDRLASRFAFKAPWSGSAGAAWRLQRWNTERAPNRTSVYPLHAIHSTAGRLDAPFVGEARSRSTRSLGVTDRHGVRRLLDTMLSSPHSDGPGWLHVRRLGCRSRLAIR